MKRFFCAFAVCFAISAWAQTCLVCGEVRSVREVHMRGAQAQARTPGPVGTPSDLHLGPVVGTVAQFNFDRSGGDWRFGAAGTPDMQARLEETTYEITIAMDVGESRTIQRRDGNRFRVGQRVALRQGELEPM